MCLSLYLSIHCSYAAVPGAQLRASVCVRARLLKELGLPVSRAATAAFEVADADPALSEADFAAIMEVAANKKKRVGF